MLVKELQCENSRSLFKLTLATSGKDADYSQLLRITGNESFKKLDDSDIQEKHTIFRLYSKSIAFAPAKSEELALGFYNRSAILFRMEKYDESMSDITKALEIIKADNYVLRIKLLCRKMECLAKQGSPKIHTVFAEVKGLVKLDDVNKNSIQKIVKKARVALKNLKEVSSEPLKVSEPSQVLSQKEKENPLDSVSIQYSDKYGKHLIAKQDFEAGDIIFVEEPFATVQQFDSSYMCCTHCLTLSLSTIPCDHCSWCMFCSESCKKEAWKEYHHIDCTIFTQLESHYGLICEYYVLMIRSIIKGIQISGSINGLRKDLQATDDSNKGK